MSEQRKKHRHRLVAFGLMTFAVVIAIVMETIKYAFSAADGKSPWGEVSLSLYFSTPFFVLGILLFLKTMPSTVQEAKDIYNSWRTGQPMPVPAQPMSPTPMPDQIPGPQGPQGRRGTPGRRGNTGARGRRGKKAQPRSRR